MAAHWHGTIRWGIVSRSLDGNLLLLGYEFTVWCGMPGYVWRVCGLCFRAPYFPICIPGPAKMIILMGHEPHGWALV